MPWPRLREAAVVADGAGYGALWVFDHVAGVSVRGDTMLEAFTLLGALAASTERIALGSLVINVAHRAAAITAVAAASVTAVSGRPFFLGLGAGSSPSSRWSAELRAVGQPIEPLLPRRHAHVEQVIETCRRLWADDRAPELATVPRPSPPTEIHVGVGSVALATLAGRLADAVNVAWFHPGRDDLVRAARTAAERADRRRPLGLTTYVPWDAGLLDPGHPERRAMSVAGIDRMILLVRDADLATLAAGPAT